MSTSLDFPITEINSDISNRPSGSLKVCAIVGAINLSSASGQQSNGFEVPGGKRAGSTADLIGSRLLLCLSATLPIYNVMACYSKAVRLVGRLEVGACAKHPTRFGMATFVRVLWSRARGRYHHPAPAGIQHETHEPQAGPIGRSIIWWQSVSLLHSPLPSDISG